MMTNLWRSCFVLATLLLATCISNGANNEDPQNELLAEENTEETPEYNGEHINEKGGEEVDGWEDLEETESSQEPEIEYVMEGSMFSVLNESDIFSSFLDAVNIAHLDSVLKREYLTLIVPTNRAIKKYGGKMWHEAVDKGKKVHSPDYYALRRLIMHHMIQPKLVSRTAVPVGSSVYARTLSGYKIAFHHHSNSKMTAEIYIGNNQTYVELPRGGEINTTNGYMHRSEQIFFDTVDVVGGGARLAYGMIVWFLLGGWTLLRL